MVGYRDIDMLIDEDPAYSPEENVDRRIAENERQYEQLKNFNKGVNQFLEPMIGEGTPIGVASDAARDLLLEGGRILSTPFNYVANQISSPDVTVADLQEKARTDKGIEGLKAQIQVPFEITGEIGKVLFDPKFFSDVQEKIKAGTSTQMDENIAAIGGAFEMVGAVDIVKYLYKKFGPEVAQMITKTPGNNSRELIQNLDIPLEQKKIIVADLIGGSNRGPLVDEGRLSFAPETGSGGSQKAQIKNKEKQQQYFNSEEARESFYDESDDINVMFDIKELNKPANQKFSYGQNIPAHEFYENQYHGGVGDLGDSDAFKKLKKLSYYPEYKKLIQESAKEHLGERFPAYRLVRGDMEAYRKGMPSLEKDINSYSLDPEWALSLHNLIDYSAGLGKNRNNLVLQEVYINAKDLVMRGKTSEEEIIVNTKKLDTDTVRVFDPFTGEMIKDATKGELVGKELFKFNEKTRLGGKKPKGFALGGTAEDYTQNVDLMSDRFMKDPGFEEEDAFAKSLEGATAFNPFNIFKTFNKVPGVATPKNVNEVNLYNQLVDTRNMGGADVGIETLLPTVKSVSNNDFAFKSFTVDKLNSADAPKNATPEAWRQFLKGGELKAPETEIFDSGMEDFFIDTEKMFPGRKISREQLIDIYNESPVGNLEIKVKNRPDYDGNVGTGSELAQFDNYSGTPRHEGFGNAAMDNYGKNYREIVIQSGPIPNDKSPYVQSSHFSEPNVIGFTRVADYKNADGQIVSVIQELQTDLLTTVNNEQMRLDAMIKRAKKKTEEQNAILNNPMSDEFVIEGAKRRLNALKKDMGGKTIEELENTGVLKPFPTNVGRERIPQLQTELGNLQDQINDITLRQNQNPMQNVGLEENIFKIQNLQKKVFDDLASMNRESTYEQQLKGVQVPNIGDNNITGQLTDYVESGGIDGRDIKTFPPVPFSRPGDYVDLLLKATIKDAQNKGINKIAIMPADVGANKRWSKTGDAAKRFTDLYDKKMVQEFKNIKKKYPGAELRIENIIDPSASDPSFFGKRLQADGTFEEVSREMIEEIPRIDFNKGFGDYDVQRQLRSFDDSYGLDNTKAFVTFKQDDGSEIIQQIVREESVEGENTVIRSFKLSDDYTTQDLKEAQFMFDYFNPGSTPMYVIDISTSSAKTGPMYLYRKKDGGTIDKDRLVSITDIYGSYGR